MLNLRKLVVVYHRERGQHHLAYSLQSLSVTNPFHQVGHYYKLMRNVFVVIRLELVQRRNVLRNELLQLHGQLYRELTRRAIKPVEDQN